MNDYQYIPWPLTNATTGDIIATTPLPDGWRVTLACADFPGGFVVWDALAIAHWIDDKGRRRATLAVMDPLTGELHPLNPDRAEPYPLLNVHGPGEPSWCHGDGDDEEVNA